MKSSTKIAAACVLFSTLSLSAQINKLPVQNEQQNEKTEMYSLLGSQPIGKDSIEWRGERQKVPIDKVPNNLGGAEETLPLKFNLYPNPSQGLVHVKFSENAAPEKIEVYSVIGNLVYKHVVEDGSAENIDLDLSQLAAGNYVVVATSTSKIHTQKLSIN